MNNGPFAHVETAFGRKLAIHHSAVVWVEADEVGAHITVRVGNSSECLRTLTSFEEVMRLLNKARRADILSFDETAS